MFGGISKITPLPFQHDHSHSVTFGVAETDPHFPNAAIGGELLRAALQNNEGFAAWLSMNVDVLPTHRFSDAGPKCFRERFLGGKARREMTGGKFHRLRIPYFADRENAPEKTFAKTIERMLNARAFHQIDADSDDAHPR